MSSTYFFCPYCGKKLKKPPRSTSLFAQFGIYFLSIFFPFFAILPGIEYLNQQDNKSKAVGTITLLLSGIFLMINVYLIVFYMDYFKELIGYDEGTISNLGLL